MNPDICINAIDTAQSDAQEGCLDEKQQYIRSELLNPLIPAAQVATWETLEQLVETFNARLAEVGKQSDQLYSQAYQAGWEAGKQEALNAQVANLLQAQEVARAYLSDHETRLQARALELVQQIIPNMPVTETLTALIQSASNALKGEAVTVIKVAPSNVERLQNQSVLKGCSLQADASLSEWDCVVATELGAIRLNWQDRVNKITGVKE